MNTVAAPLFTTDAQIAAANTAGINAGRAGRPFDCPHNAIRDWNREKAWHAGWQIGSDQREERRRAAGRVTPFAVPRFAVARFVFASGFVVVATVAVLLNLRPILRALVEVGS